MYDLSIYAHSYVTHIHYKTIYEYGVEQKPQQKKANALYRKVNKYKIYHL